MPIEFAIVILQVQVKHIVRHFLLQLDLRHQLLILLLLELSVVVVCLHRRDVLHVFPDDVLHMERVEVLLIRDCVSHSCFYIFKLPEFYFQHVVQTSKIFLNVANYWSASKFVEGVIQTS